MAGIYNYYCTMIDLTFLQLLILSAAFATILKIVEAVEGHSQAFIQTDGELRYLVDGISVQLQEALSSGSTSVSFTDVDDDNLHMYASPIRFQPSSLNFREHPVGVPAIEKVLVVNPSSDTSIHMLSISGSTSDFHCSFFVEKVVPPGGNTTFDVVFLGRHEGSVKNTLFIHTSLGSFKYQVKALGIPNPYRLKPFLGVRMPLNSSYSPVIALHNPYSSTLQVTEMYSSGADLHLELPSGELEASQHVWEIPPFETKSVMKASFVARVENNHTAFIRIKTNSSFNGNLVLPVEVEVSSVPGIYSPVESLDFGVIRSQDSVKTLSLQLLNYGHKQIHIQNVIVTPVNDAVSIKFQPTKVPPDTLHPTTIASVSYDPSKAVHPKQHQGKIVVKSKNSQFKLTIPYHVVMLQGSLFFDPEKTQFYLGKNHSEDILLRELSVTNSFNVSIIIHEYMLFGNASSFIKVNDFKSVVAKAGETVQLLKLEIKHSKAFSTHSILRLFTNISHFDLPLICYNGKMKKYVMPDLNDKEINLGTLGTGEKRDVYFVLINENPVQILLKSFRSNLTKTFVELVGVEKGNLTNVIQRQSFSGMSRSLIIQPNHFIVFRVGITSPSVQGKSYGEIAVETPYETIRLPLTFSTVMGSLNSDMIIFENAFPGKISWKPLQIYSSFLHSMTITSVVPVPSDERFYFDTIKSSAPFLKSGMKNYIGKVFFDPTRKCFPECYLGLPLNSAVGQKWLTGLSIPPDIGSTDHDIYLSLWQRWKDLVHCGKNSMNVTFEVNTNELKGFRLQGQAQMHWPHLANKQKIKFPLTQIGNTTVREFALENPSGLPVIAQVLILPMYSSPESIVNLLQPNLAQQILGSLSNENKNVFTLQDTEFYNPSADNPISSYRKSIKDYFRVEPLNTSIALMLTPGMRVQIKLGFSPNDEAFHTSLILIRNNLTILDSLVIQAQGGYGQVKFGNKKPGSISPLQFEILEKHMKDCLKSKHSEDSLPNFTVRRSFTARNFGELPIFFHGFAINEIACEGFGFKILNCQSFLLQPNDSRKIDIAFTPDFTMSKVHRTLNIFSSLSPGGLILNYSLVATIPPHLMLKCASIIPRPKWEKSLMLILLCMLVMLMVCVSLTAYVEGNRILTYSFLPIISSVFPYSEEYEKSKVLDLKKFVFNEEKNKPVENHKLNNHCHSKKRTTSTPETCTNVLNIAFKGKKLNNWSNNKPNVENQILRYKDTGNNNSFHVKDMESEMEHATNSKSVSRKRAKRLSLTDNLLTSEASSNNAPSDKNHSTSHSRQWTNLFQSQSSNFKKNMEQINFKSNKENKSSNCSTNADSPPAVSAEKTSRTKTKGKTKHSAKLENVDTKVNKPKIQIPDPDVVDEDSSSTTTESSNADADTSSDKQSTKSSERSGSQKKDEQRTSKSKNSKLKDSEKPTKNREDYDFDDKDFELSTKSKAHRKIKIDHRVYGGDILRPNTLELPYQLKSISYKEEKDPQIPPPNKVNKNSFIKTKDKIPDLCRSPSLETTFHNPGKGFGTPQWDQPEIFQNSDDALCELSKQTEMFAKKHGRPSTEYTSKMPVSYMRSRQSSGFTINSESKKQSVKHPGTIGQRCTPQTSNVMHLGETTLLSPGTPQTPHGSPFFSSTLYQENAPTPLPLSFNQNEGSSHQKEIKNSFAFSNSETFSIKNIWDSPLAPEDDSLQASARPLQNNHWSNFGLDMDSHNNLWNPNFKERSSIWTHKEPVPVAPKHNVTKSLFGSTPLPWENMWASAGEPKFDVSSPESNTSGMAASVSPIVTSFSSSSSSSSPSPLGDKKLLEQDAQAKRGFSMAPGFDPFSSHQIWQPTSRSNQQDTENDNDWSFSYFSNNDPDN